MEALVAAAEAGGEPISPHVAKQARTLLLRVEVLLGNAVPRARRHTQQVVSAELSSEVVCSRDYLDVVMQFTSLRDLLAVASVSRAWSESAKSAVASWATAEHWAGALETGLGRRVVQECLELCALHDDHSPVVAIADASRARIWRILEAAVRGGPATMPACMHAMTWPLLCWIGTARDTTGHDQTMEAARSTFATLMNKWSMRKDTLKTGLKPLLILFTNTPTCCSDRHAFEVIPLPTPPSVFLVLLPCLPGSISHTRTSKRVLNPPPRTLPPGPCSRRRVARQVF